MKELINVMSELLNVLIHLRDAAFKKQRALIENNLENIEAAISEEEKILSSLQNIHKRRIQILDQATN